MSQTVLITGCSTGFGKLAAQTFSQNGWDVVATMRNTDAGVDLAAMPNTLVEYLDVTDLQSIDDVVAKACSRFGGIDVLVNNAGYGGQALFERATDSSIRRMFETNVFGPMNTMRCVLPVMRKQGHGVIVNVTSMAALMPVPGSSIYTASKHAANGLTEAMALEYAPLGVRVCLVEPGAFPTTAFNANVDMSSAGDDEQLDAHEKRIREHFAGQVERVASESDRTNDPQLVADAIYRCATEEMPIHNPVGSDAQMLVGMMAASESRQAFIDAVSPLLIPPTE